MSSNTFYIAGHWQPSRPHFRERRRTISDLFSIAKNALSALLGCNELPLLLLPQQVSICVNNLEIYQYTRYSHNIVGDAFTKLIRGVPPPLTAKDVIASIKLRARSSAV